MQNFQYGNQSPDSQPADCRGPSKGPANKDSAGGLEGASGPAVDRSAACRAVQLDKTEIQEVSPYYGGRLLLRVQSMEEQGQLLSLFGNSLSDVRARANRMRQANAIATNDQKEIAFLEAQDENFRIENVLGRRNPAEIGYTLHDLNQSDDRATITNRGWFAAACLQIPLPAPGYESALAFLEKSDRMTAGTSQRLARAKEPFFRSMGAERPDLIDRFEALLARSNITSSAGY
jgi:hypothetical protein